MTPDERNTLKYHLETDWTALEFVLHFMSVDDETRYTIIAELEEETHTPCIKWDDVLAMFEYYNTAVVDFFVCRHSPAYTRRVLTS